MGILESIPWMVDLRCLMNVVPKGESTRFAPLGCELRTYIHPHQDGLDVTYLLLYSLRELVPGSAGKPMLVK